MGIFRTVSVPKFFMETVIFSALHSAHILFNKGLTSALIATSCCELVSIKSSKLIPPPGSADGSEEAAGVLPSDPHLTWKLLLIVCAGEAEASVPVTSTLSLIYTPAGSNGSLRLLTGIQAA